VIDGDDAVTTTVAGLIENVSEPCDAEWLVSPTNEYVAVDVPTFVFDVYDGVRLVRFNPPAPVTEAEHSVCAEPEYVVVFGEHTTVVTEAAWSITNDDRAEEIVWFASPAYDATAEAVLAFVFPRYLIEAVVERPPAPVTAAEHGV
jgi:hypothetical protein